MRSRALLGSFSLGKSRIQFIEQSQTFFRGPSGSENSESRLCIKLGEADRGPFLEQLVHADIAVLGQLAKAGVFIVGQADGKCAHGEWLGLDKLFRSQNFEGIEAKLPSADVSCVLSNDGLCAPGHGQLNQMIVALVRQIGSPKIIYFYPFADGQERLQKSPAVLWGERAELHHIKSIKEVFIFCKKSHSQERLQFSPQAPPQYFTIVPTALTQGGSDQNVCIYHYSCHQFVVTAYTPSCPKAISFPPQAPSSRAQAFYTNN